MTSPLTGPTDSADVVVVGGGTVGGWAAWFLRRAGLRVVLVERGVLGSGASSRAAGMVRGQGGTPAAVVLGVWSRDFYRSQGKPGAQGEINTIDSGFITAGYYLPAFTPAQLDAARARLAMQLELGLQVEWLDADAAERRNPTLAPGSTLGGTYAAADGYLDPPRNVMAYSVALATAGVEVRERTEFLGLTGSGVLTSCAEGMGGNGGDGGRPEITEIRAPRVLLTGGPTLAEVGSRAGVRIPAGGVRHQVAVTQPHAELAPERLPMVFDVAGGIYWRPEADGGLLFGMSNPDEPPGPAQEIDVAYLTRVRERLAGLVPVTKGLGLRRCWAATIDYTPDHLPIFGPALDAGGQAIDGVSVASAGGHGMMWGPAVSRVAADLVLDGSTTMFEGTRGLGRPGSDQYRVDVEDLYLTRFDEQGRSKLAADPIALPFPEV